MSKEKLRQDINSLLSSMKVEEYGVTPQSETLDKIMALIDEHSNPSKKRLWAVEMTRESEEPFFGHYESETEPTEDEIVKWLSDEHEIYDNPDYSKYDWWEVKL